MAILTSASALDRADLELAEEDRHELLEAILIEAARLDRIVSNLLDLSRLQSGAAQPDLALCSVDDLVVQAIADVDDADRVQVALGAGSPAVRADAHQIERALANLIENALKYSPPEEPVRLQVSGTPSEVHVRVIDHGPGIPAEELDRLFEPFQRGGARRGSAAPGSAWRSPAASPRPTAAASGPSPAPVRAPRSCWHSRPSRLSRCTRDRVARAGGGRRAADPAGAAHQPARRRLRGGDGGHGRGGAGRGRDAAARCRDPRSGAAGRQRHGRRPGAADVELSPGDRALGSRRRAGEDRRARRRRRRLRHQAGRHRRAARPAARRATPCQPRPASP